MGQNIGSQATSARNIGAATTVVRLLCSRCEVGRIRQFVMVGFWYYQAACLIGGSEVPGLSTRPAARCVTMRIILVVSPTPPKLSFPILLPSTNQVTEPGLLGLTGQRVVPGLDQKPTRRRLLRSLLYACFTFSASLSLGFSFGMVPFFVLLN